MKLTFCGAARMVTGSCYLVEAENQKALVDCGMFQGSKEINRLNYQDFPFDPREIDYVFLTHAHIDHCGLIPKLAKMGFDGQVVATPATVDLCRLMLEDSANVQESETEGENRRRLREGQEEREPLYTLEEAKDSFRLMRKLEYDKQRDFGVFSVKYRDAGHILGSAIIELTAEGKKIVFSGDVGQWGSPIVRDPTLIESADYLLIESTYGDRLHEDIGIRGKRLLEVAKGAHQKGGKLLIPSFAMERTQELLYTIKGLFKTGEFPNERVFLDSPLAMRLTEVYLKHPECYDEEMAEILEPLSFKNLVYTRKVQESQKINTYGMPCVVIAGNGMCTGGRIRHHLKHGIWDSKNTLLFIGYQAEGTLGRVILEGAKTIRMMGMELAVKADVKSIDGFSAHADYSGLLKWAKGFKNRPRTFVVHGEHDASKALKSRLQKEGFKASVPEMLESVEL